jgi:hypothetical protein
MRKLIAAAAALFLNLAVVLPAAAQATSDATTFQGVMTICSAVIAEQYEDDHDRDGQCIAAVGTYLDAIGAPSSEADPLIAELVVALAELYQDDPACKIGDTELPEAIALAASRTEDDVAAAEYVLIADQIDTCQFEATAAINDALATDA